jgi:hypothetical protein
MCHDVSHTSGHHAMALRLGGQARGAFAREWAGRDEAEVRWACEAAFRKQLEHDAIRLRHGGHARRRFAHEWASRHGVAVK